MKNIALTVSIFLFLASTAPAYTLSDSLAVHSRTSAVDKLSEAITFKTVSAVDHRKFRYEEFVKLHAYFKQAFPLVHRYLQLEVINHHSLLYTWKGTDKGLLPILLSAHMDVVPVEQASEQLWEQGPYLGAVQGGYIWGRGTMDDKYRVVAILEAVERSLEKGFMPSRTIYLAFGHDEEVGGKEGAGAISEHLQLKGVKLEAVFDEGLAVAEGVLPGIQEPLALVGTAAKGDLNLRLTVRGAGGHSSVPPKDTPIDILSAALTRIHDNPFEPRMTSTTRQTIGILADKLGGKYKFAMRHYGLFKGRVLKMLAEDRATDALIRTKASPTVIAAGDKFNVLPRVATAVINIRILNGETQESVLAHIKKAIDDPRVELQVHGVYTPPSPVTETNTPMYEALSKTIKVSFPGVIVVPALFPGATDSKHYTNLTSNIFRFAPQVVNRENAQLIHNVNERLSVEVFEGCIMFYERLLHNTSGTEGGGTLVDAEHVGTPVGISGK